MPQTETLANLEAVIQEISDYPSGSDPVDVGPAGQWSPAYKSTAYVRSNEKIQALNQAYRQLANAYMNVQFIDLYDAFLDEEGRAQTTADGLHLTISGYGAPVQGFCEYLSLFLKIQPVFARTELFIFLNLQKFSRMMLDFKGIMKIIIKHIDFVKI